MDGIQSKGGRARDLALTSDEKRAIAKKGGEASRRKMTAKQRSDAARVAVTARWDAVRAAAEAAAAKLKSKVPSGGRAGSCPGVRKR